MTTTTTNAADETNEYFTTARAQAAEASRYITLAREVTKTMKRAPKWSLTSYREQRAGYLAAAERNLDAAAQNYRTSFACHGTADRSAEISDLRRGLEGARR